MDQISHHRANSGWHIRENRACYIPLFLGNKTKDDSTINGWAVLWAGTIFIVNHAEEHFNNCRHNALSTKKMKIRFDLNKKIFPQKQEKLWRVSILIENTTRFKN